MYPNATDPLGGKDMLLTVYRNLDWHIPKPQNNGWIWGLGILAVSQPTVRVVAFSYKFVFEITVLAWGAILFFTKGEKRHARTSTTAASPEALRF